MEAFDNTVKRYTRWLDNEYVAGALTVFLIAYAGIAAPKLPSYIVKWFDYTLVKVVLFFLIVYLSKRNATVALVAAIALIVSIMALDKVKFGEEMMEVVKSEGRNGRKMRMNGCVCDCEDVEDIVPQTEEGHLVVSEAKRAVAEGALHPADAKNLAKNVVVAEKEGAPVLVAKTEEGAKRMEEIAKAENNGAVSEQEAKTLAARVVVGEIVAESKPEEQNIRAESESPRGEVSMEELAQEVLKRKQEETERRGGVAPSGEELRQMCAGVLNEYKRSPSCKSGCGSSSSSEVSANDEQASSYASADA
jgi:hypothetical protein